MHLDIHIRIRDWRRTRFVGGRIDEECGCRVSVSFIASLRDKTKQLFSSITGWNLSGAYTPRLIRNEHDGGGSRSLIRHCANAC